MTKRNVTKAFLWAAAVLLTFVALIAVWLVLDARRTPIGTPEYVALGSSYAAGAGLGPRQPGSPRLCQRSNNGYPPRLARHLGLSLVDMTCSGSVTSDALNGGQFFQNAQIRTISPATKLVTVTAGGNDVGFVRDLFLLSSRNSDTWFGWMVRTFWGGPPNLGGRGFDKMESTLASLIRTIRRQAPFARIVVATYPAVLPRDGTCSQLRLARSEAEVMRQVQSVLAARTREVARREGAIVVDMTTIGTGHSACSATPWTRGWGPLAEAPFHPNEAGASATSQAIAAALR